MSGPLMRDPRSGCEAEGPLRASPVIVVCWVLLAGRPVSRVACVRASEYRTNVETPKTHSVKLKVLVELLTQNLTTYYLR